MCVTSDSIMLVCVINLHYVHQDELTTHDLTSFVKLRTYYIPHSCKAHKIQITQSTHLRRRTINTTTYTNTPSPTNSHDNIHDYSTFTLEY